MNRKNFLKVLGASSLFLGIKPVSVLDKLKEGQATERMPVLFLGHGSPMNAIEENVFVRGFREVAKTIPRPKAILCVSAHWETRGTKVTAMEMPRTIHDFGGFPRELYEVQYPAKGHPVLASETAQMLVPDTIAMDHSWGLDHGAWSVIKHLYPDANVPVIQLSLDISKSPEAHFELASRLQRLRDRGILIIGSGNIVHNLGMVDWPNLNKMDHGYDWAREARTKLNHWIQDGNFGELTSYTKQGRAIQLAIPSSDHYLPLLYTLALKQQSESLELFNDHLLAGSLSMTSVKIG